jgi:hypothetical protein
MSVRKSFTWAKVPSADDHDTRALGGTPMAGWGDDPKLAELRTLVYEDGWTPVSVSEGAGSVDTVVVEKDGEQQTFSSDHIAFHRFVEGVKEDFGL